MSNEFNEEVDGFELTEFNLEKLLDGILMDESTVSVELYELRKICESVKEEIDKIQLSEKYIEIGRVSGRERV